MAYTQRFGLSRKSPVALIGQNTIKKYSKKPEESNKKDSSNPATDIINKNNKKSSDSYTFLDGVTDALTVGGMAPAVGIVPDAINTGLNLGRAVVAAVTGGDTSKYLTNAALAGGAMIPGIGQGVSGTKLAAKVLPKTVKAVKGLDKTSKVLKTGKVAKNIKKAKGAGIIGTNTGLISSIDRDKAMENRPELLM
jgi:hypothetical protein